MLDIRCQEHLDAVKQFAASVGLTEQLQSKLDYLSNYGYHPDDTDPLRRCENRCTLYKDRAPHSFQFSIERPTLDILTGRPDGGWRHWFSGGLIYQGPDNPANGSFPTLTVSLAEGDGWYVHT